MIKKMCKNQKGFTLIELIVVIAIIGILAGVLLPKFSGFQDTAREGAIKSDAKNIATAVEAILAEGKASELGSTVAEAESKIWDYIGKDLGGDITAITPNDGHFTYEKEITNKMCTAEYDGEKIEVDVLGE